MGTRGAVVAVIALGACGRLDFVTRSGDAEGGCKSNVDCAGDTPICDAGTCRIARGCGELAAQVPTTASGLHMIDPDSSGGVDAFRTYCQGAEGGSWTLVQRTLWAWADNQALKTNYATWLGTTFGMPDPGNAYRLAGELWPTVGVAGDIMVIHRVRTTTGGACAPLYYVGTGGMFAVGPTSATLTGLSQPVDIISADALSATDTGPNSSCLNSGAIPWFYASCCSTCPTFMGGYWTDEPHPIEAYTNNVPDANNHRETDVCGGDAVQVSLVSAYRGADTMEIYLR